MFLLIFYNTLTSQFSPPLKYRIYFKSVLVTHCSIMWSSFTTLGILSLLFILSSPLTPLPIADVFLSEYFPNYLSWGAQSGAFSFFGLAFLYCTMYMYVRCLPVLPWMESSFLSRPEYTIRYQFIRSFYLLKGILIAFELGCLQMMSP